MRYTPRELQGWMDFHSRVQASRDDELLSIMAVAGSGDNKVINKMRKELEKLV